MSGFLKAGWVAGCVVAGLALQACAPKGTPEDTSAIRVAAVPNTRWTSNAPGWDQSWNTPYPGNWGSYQGTAFGPGSAYPIARNTLRNPDVNDEYLPLLDNPMFGAISQEEAPPGGFQAIEVPSEDYYVNGVSLGPSVDRQQAGYPIKAK